MGNICTHCLLELKAPIQQKAQQPLQLVAVGPQKLNRLAGLCSCSRCLWFGGEREAVRLLSQAPAERSNPAVTSVLALQAPQQVPKSINAQTLRALNCRAKVLKERWLCFKLGLLQPSLKPVGVFPLTSLGFGWPHWGFLAQASVLIEPGAGRGRSSCSKVNHC